MIIIFFYVYAIRGNLSPAKAKEQIDQRYFGQLSGGT